MAINSAFPREPIPYPKNAVCNAECEPFLPKPGIQSSLPPGSRPHTAMCTAERGVRGAEHCASKGVLLLVSLRNHLLPVCKISAEVVHHL